MFKGPRVNRNVTSNISSKGKNERMEGMLDRKERRQDIHFDHWPIGAPKFGHGSTTSEECGVKCLLCTSPSQLSLLSDPCSCTNISKKYFMAPTDIFYSDNIHVNINVENVLYSLLWVYCAVTLKITIIH